MLNNVCFRYRVLTKFYVKIQDNKINKSLGIPQVKEMHLLVSNEIHSQIGECIMYCWIKVMEVLYFLPEEGGCYRKL